MELISELTASLRRVETHEKVRQLYKYDLLKLPFPLNMLVKTPLAVVQPESVEEVLRVLKIARKYRIAVVPRGAATSAYGGAVPIRRSIVVDFTRMKGATVESGKLIAESGVVWLDAERLANTHGYALRIYPTSAPASTVGGWVAQNGYGVGSLAYGSVAENVEWVEIADFSGTKRVSGRDLQKYVGACGTTGLILRVCLKLRENTPIGAEARFVGIEKAVEMLEGYHAAYFSPVAMERVCGKREETLLIAREGGESNELGRFLWERRFFPLLAVRDDTVFSEALLPIDTVQDFVAEAEKLTKLYEVSFAKRDAVVFAAFPAGKYLRALKFLKVAEKHGGRPYGSGLLFPNQKGLADFKRSVDPLNILNPGKVVEGNAISKLLRLAGLIAWIV
ncbi:MAG: FAD-binding oxidoreductase [Archaeoglobaceae archaeon]